MGYLAPLHPPPPYFFLGQSVRVIVTNEGAISTHFTITEDVNVHEMNPSEGPGLTITDREAEGEKRALSVLGTPGEEKEEDGARNQLTTVANEEGEKKRSEEGDSLHPMLLTEAELLEKASAVGDASMSSTRDGSGVFVVVGGGELAGYGSSEIVVTFGPLSVGNFRVVKVTVYACFMDG